MPDKKSPLKQMAYEAIKANILNCTYAPGTIINEELIQEQVNASRTPIRDALSRLEQEGLIRILPKKGILVNEFSLKELNMLYETRFLIEPYAVRTYGNRIPLETYLEYYYKYNNFLKDTSQYYSFEEMDDSFHNLFINAADNTYLSNVYETIESQIIRTRIVTGKVSTSRLNDTMKEHLDIVKAAMKEDWNGAAAAMLNHLKISKNAYFSYMMNKGL